MRIIDGKLGDKESFPIGIVVSRFNHDITKGLLDGTVARLKELGFPEDDITIAWVPGAIEIPIAAQRLAQLGTYDAIICLGAVVRGETTHYDYVCNQVSEGCQHVALQNDIPVVFGVLTTENEEQARDRIGGKEGHKGREAADTAVDIVAVLREIG